MDLLRIAEERLTEEPAIKARAGAEIQPVHVFYGGADLFSSEIHLKLGRLARSSFDLYAPDFIAFAAALWLKGADSLPDSPEMSSEVEKLLRDDPERAESAYPGAGFCLEVFTRTRDRLSRKPVEDYRIDFEDGYGFRPDEEEDADARRAGSELGNAFVSDTDPSLRPSYGFRVKSLSAETRRRSIRTLEMFLTSLAEVIGGELREEIAVTLPKVGSAREVAAFREILESAEREMRLGTGKLRLEVMVETPAALDCLGEIADAGGNRLRGVHFGAYDYTSLLGISSDRQHLHHESCVYARSKMLSELSGSGLWLSDSVTTRMPVPVHRGDGLKDWQKQENRRTVHAAWRLHYSNIIRSMASGYYQSWDLHPAQLVARFGAVLSFYLESAESEISRLRAFIAKATKATLTGSAFDDAASAEGLLNFIRRGISCGALDADETAALVGITAEELADSSFREIVGGKN